MGKDWFKYEAAIYDKKEGCYIQARSSFFEFISSWQRIALKTYQMGGQWMIETRKIVPEAMLEMNKMIKTLTMIYDEITLYP